MNQLAENSSILIQILQAYGLGFLSSFTPCVFPLIPITLALFGAKETNSRLQSFLLGLFYVSGIAFTYTILGMISAKLGMVFGSLLGNIYVVFAITAFLFLIALQTLEMLEFRFLSSLQTKASGIGGKGFGGAFLMGTASGLVAAPCIGPALIIVLSAAAKSQNIAWGASLLFSYAIGLGTIFLILATFSNLITKLPKSGNWLNGVKFLLAALLLVIIIFLNQSRISAVLNQFPIYSYLEIFAALNIFAVYLAWLSYNKNIKILRLIAAVVISFTIYQFFFPGHAPQNNASEQQHINWNNNLEQAMKEADSENKILVVDFYADWCTACKEFEHDTFTNSAVIEKLNSLVTARVDFTDSTTDQAVALSERYGIPGLPLILFIKPGSNGEEIDSSRITGFLNSEEFLKHLEKYAG